MYYLYISYCTISIYTPSNILEISSPVVLLALPVRPESLAVVLQWSRPAAGHPGRCSPLGACAWCPRWVWHGAGFIPVPMHVYIHWYMMIYWLIHADCSEDLQWLNRLSTVVVCRVMHRIRIHIMLHLGGIRRTCRAKIWLCTFFWSERSKWRILQSVQRGSGASALSHSVVLDGISGYFLQC